MKSRILAGLMIFGLVAAVPAQAQTLAVGAKGGLNLGDMLGDDIGDADARVGFNAGGFFSVPVSESFRIQVEGIFSQKGGVFEGIGGTTKLKLAYVDIPILAKMVFTDRVNGSSVPYLLAGPSVSVEISCEVGATSFTGEFVERDCEDSSFQGGLETQSLDFGAVFGGGVQVPSDAGAFEIEGRMNWGVRSLDDTPLDLEVRTVTFSLSAGFMVFVGG